MTSRNRLIIGVVLAAVTALLALIAVPLAFGGPTVQIDPTQQQQTIDALVGQRFTQTAAVAQQIGLTQTAEAATLLAPTMTAAFEATVDAAFNQALTATAAAGATATTEAELRPYAALIERLQAEAAATDSEVSAWLDGAQLALAALVGEGGLVGADPAAVAERLATAQAANALFAALAVYDAEGRVQAASDPALAGEDVAGEPYFAASLAGPQIAPPAYDSTAGAWAVIVTQPITDASSQTVAVLAGWLDLAALDRIVARHAAPDTRLRIVLVDAATRFVLAPTGLADAVDRPHTSVGIERALRGESGAGLYSNDAEPAVPVVGVFRWLPSLNAALLAEVPIADAAAVLAALPTLTPTPGPGVPTPLPPLFPTPTRAEVQIAEQVFEYGRMFWIRHTRQIWVMVNVPRDNRGGDWYCFYDTFEEGEPEIDPALVPPEERYQPRRGFGKLWRTHPDIRAALGWALTPEFELTSQYTYLAGGYVDGNTYYPGPGEHRLTTLYNESISFFEGDVRGDCLGGTWRMTTP